MVWEAYHFWILYLNISLMRRIEKAFFGRCAKPQDVSDISQTGDTNGKVREGDPSAWVDQTQNGAEQGSKKKGRRELWVPRALTSEDIARTKMLRATFSPNVEAAEKFFQKYLKFAELNGYKEKPGDCLLLAIGQAREMGAAASSTNTQFQTMLKQRRIPFRDAWEASTLLNLAHCDASAVQPRTFGASPGEDLTQEGLAAIVEGIDRPAVMALAWMCFATGSRAISIVRLRGCQVLLTADSLTLQRRWSKTTQTRSKRDTLTYSVAWSMDPPEEVSRYLELGVKNGEELIFPNMQGAKASTMLTQALRKSSKSKSITSYVFRDFMQERLEAEGLEEQLIERLMEHSAGTARACYRRDDLTKAACKRAVTEKKKREAKKCAERKATKKPVAVAPKKKTNAKRK